MDKPSVFTGQDPQVLQEFNQAKLQEYDQDQSEIANIIKKIGENTGVMKGKLVRNDKVQQNENETMKHEQHSKEIFRAAKIVAQ